MADTDMEMRVVVTNEKSAETVLDFSNEDKQPSVETIGMKEEILDGGGVLSGSNIQHAGEYSGSQDSVDHSFAPLATGAQVSLGVINPNLEEQAANNQSFPQGFHTGHSLRRRWQSAIQLAQIGMDKKKRIISRKGWRQTVMAGVNIPWTENIFMSLVSLTWQHILYLFGFAHIGSWLMFGVVWYIINVSRLKIDDRQCFAACETFGDFFLLSLETQTSIGYGSRAPESTVDCPEVVIVIIMQSIFSVVLNSLLTGVLFIKFTQPTSRRSTVLFSKKACIALRDNKYILMFRICDARKRQLSEVTARLYLYRHNYSTKEGKVINYMNHQLRCGFNFTNIRDDSDRLFMALPETVCHIIDNQSPLYNLSRTELNRQKWEVVVIMEGCIETTGSTLQATYSYTMDQIKWGYDFENIVRPEDWTQTHIPITLHRVHTMKQISYMPLISAADFYKEAGDPHDMFAEQEELWDGSNFFEPEDRKDSSSSSSESEEENAEEEEKKPIIEKQEGEEKDDVNGKGKMKKQ